MGGNPALDFVDTIGGELVEEPAADDEFLREYEDLVVFGLKRARSPSARRGGCGARPESGRRRPRLVLARAREKNGRRWCSAEGCGTDVQKERYVAPRRARRAGSSSG